MYKVIFLSLLFYLFLLLLYIIHKSIFKSFFNLKISLLKNNYNKLFLVFHVNMNLIFQIIYLYMHVYYYILYSCTFKIFIEHDNCVCDICEFLLKNIFSKVSSFYIFCYKTLLILTESNLKFCIVLDNMI